MNKIMNSQGLTGWTTDEIINLGNQWIESSIVEFHQNEGQKKGRATLFLLQAEEKFGHISDTDRKKVFNADWATLEKWSLRLLKFDTLDDVFGV